MLYCDVDTCTVAMKFVQPIGFNLTAHSQQQVSWVYAELVGKVQYMTVLQQLGWSTFNAAAS